MTDPLRRTLLFVPGDDRRKISKALALEVDGVILDLEDSVSPEMKEQARQVVLERLRLGGFGDKERVVRINALSTAYGLDDLKTLVPARPDTLLIPKVEGPEDIQTYDRLLTDLESQAGLPPGGIGLIALIETPLAVVQVEGIASAASRMTGLLFGAADFTREIGGRISEDRQELFYPMMRLLLAARIAGINAIDTPYFRLNDPQGLRRQAEQARNMGYDGKALIHPDQAPVVNEVFSPTEEEVRFAQNVIEGYRRAREVGKGVFALEGKMIEHIDVVRAEKTLKRAARIRGKEA